MKRVIWALVLLAGWGCGPDLPPKAPLEEASAALGAGSGPAPAGRTEAESGHLLVQIAREGGTFRIVERTRVPTPLPHERGTPPLRADDWTWVLVDREGRPVARGSLDDPALVRGEFAAEDDPARIEAVRVRLPDPVYFTLRLPAGSEGRIELRGPRAGADGERALLGTVDLAGRQP